MPGRVWGFESPRPHYARAEEGRAESCTPISTVIDMTHAPEPCGDQVASDTASSPAKEFSVGFQSRARGGGGRLIVRPGHLEVVAGPLSSFPRRSRSFVHRHDRVEVVATRLTPPWCNVRVPIRSTGGSAVALLPQWDRAEMLHALQAAGFEVIERTEWWRWHNLP